MLIGIKVENFKSFDDLTEMTFISSSKIQSKKDHSIKLKNAKVLKYGVIYGANAAGKSNLVDFFRFIKDTVTEGLPLYSREYFCKNQQKNIGRVSNFEVSFSIEKKVYAYGFSALLSEGIIESEWLYDLSNVTDAKLLFERTKGKAPVLGDIKALPKEDKDRFSVYSSDFSDNNDRVLFLSEMNRGKKIRDKSKLSFFNRIYNWIDRNLIVIRPNSIFQLTKYYMDDSIMQLSQIIRSFDTGITEVNFETISLEKLERSLPQDVFKEYLTIVQEKLKDNDGRAEITLRSNESFFNFSIKKNEEPIITTICMHHGQSFYDFHFEDESDGTRRLFDLIDMLLDQDEHIYVVDELERSLHPKLTEHFLQLFMKLNSEKNKQLLFTTHEATIMDQSLFRRDEIWFVERDLNNKSSVYSLDRFKERYDKMISKAYLEGRYGAIPVFSEFSFNNEQEV